MRPARGSPGYRVAPASAAHSRPAAFPATLPGGRPVVEAGARVDVGAAWGSSSLPSRGPRHRRDPRRGGGRRRSRPSWSAAWTPTTSPTLPLASPRSTLAPFVVSLELRHSAVTERADVVLPVAPVAEKSGTFVDWEGRARPFDVALPDSPSMSDARVLAALADAMDVDLGVADARAARAELVELGEWDGGRVSFAPVDAEGAPAVGDGEAVLATWRMLLDDGRLQDGEPHLAGTARRPVARLSAATAEANGLVDGAPVSVAGPRGALTCRSR